MEVEQALTCWAGYIRAFESMEPFAGVSRVSFRLWTLLCFEQPRDPQERHLVLTASKGSCVNQ